MTVNFYDKINYTGITQKVASGIEKRKALLKAAVLQDSNFYIPHDTGTLEDSGIIGTVLNDGTDAIKWKVPYARKNYYFWYEGMPNSHNRNLNACARWFEAAKSTRLDEWIGIIRGLYGTN